MQLNIRKNLRDQFPIRPWIDIVTKSDLRIERYVQEQLPHNALFVSPKTGEGMDDLYLQIRAKILDLSILLDERKTQMSSTGDK